MSIVNNFLSLPARRLTGFTGPASSGRDRTAVTESFDWAGRPVGLASDGASYPLLGTLEGAARFAGLSVAAYAAETAYSVAVSVNRARTTLPPRAVVYHDSLGYQACLALSSELSSRAISAYLAPANEIWGGLYNPLVVSCGPTGTQTVNEPDLSDSSTVSFDLATSAPEEWVGGEVLYLSPYSLGRAGNTLSFSELQVLPDQVTFDNMIAESQSLWDGFYPRYARVRSFAAAYAILDLTPEDYGNAAYHRSVLGTIFGGIDGVEIDDVGDFDGSPGFPGEAAFNAAMTSSFVGAIRDFFGIP